MVNLKNTTELLWNSNATLISDDKKEALSDLRNKHLNSGPDAGHKDPYFVKLQQGYVQIDTFFAPMLKKVVMMKMMKVIVKISGRIMLNRRLN